ncbi:MAG: TonB-dependent receptor [Bacteroides sp.]|nr:TonB-dependent receptor [Bacteroides sp.]
MSGKTKVQLFCALFCCIGISPLAAQKVASDTITGKVHRIEKVIVTARRSPHKVTSAVPVQTLSQQDISRLGIQNMADAVRRFAGASVKDYGGIGGLKTVSIRNIGAAHTAVSYDGVAVSNCQAGQIDIGRFSLDNVSMLSLAIGQSEDLLQSARLYASAGVLGIETEKPYFDEGRNAAFQARVRGGSFGMVSPSLRWWQKMGSRTRLAVDAGYMRADGNYPFTLVNGKYVTEERRNNSDIYSWQGEATLYHTFEDGGELDVKGYYFYSRRGLPGAVTLYNPLSDETLWDENTFLQARYRKHFSPQWSLQAQAKYNHGWNKYQDEGKEYTDGYYRENHRQDEYYLSTTVLYRPLEALTLSLAQDGVMNKLRNSLPECPFPTRYTSITALNARYKQEWLTVTASLLYTATSEHTEKGTAPDNFHRFAPSLSVSMQPWQTESLYFRLMYKSTFRLPTFNDLYYYRMGSRNLRPEKADEWNAGITWSKSGGTVFDYFSVTLDGYYNDVTDKIVAFPTTYAWKMANYGKVHAAGVDATLAATVPLTEKIRLTLSGSYMWQKAIDLTDSKNKNYKDQLPYTPLHSGNAAAVLEMPWVNVGYSAVGVGKRYYLSQNLPENEIAGYVEHTVSLSRELALGGSRLLLQAEIVNLTDEQYDVIKYYPMPGRSWRLTGTFKF